MPRLTSKNIEAGLREIGRRARDAGEIIEIAIYGGSAIVLAFGFRRATADVDVVVLNNSRSLRRYAREVALEHGWDETWMNDAVKGFVSAHAAASLRPFRSYPDENEPGLRVLVPTAEYLLAMKCMAMRIDAADRTHDLDDIRRLMDETGRRDAASVLEIVERFYPPNLITPRIAFGIEQIAAEYAKSGHAVQTPDKPRGGRRTRRT
jgi:hypothetical protein